MPVVMRSDYGKLVAIAWMLVYIVFIVHLMMMFYIMRMESMLFYVPVVMQTVYGKYVNRV